MKIKFILIDFIIGKCTKKVQAIMSFIVNMLELTLFTQFTFGILV